MGKFATDQIANEAITTDLIKDGTIDTTDIADAAVSSDKIEDGTINDADMAFNAGFSLGADVQIKVVDHTVLTSENGTVYTNEGAPGVVTFTLPPAAKGLHYWFLTTETSELRVDPDGTEIIHAGALTGGPGNYLTCGAIAGCGIHLIAVGAGEWWTMAQEGSWTFEP